MSPPALVLARHSLRRMRGVLVILAVLVAAFQFLLTQVAAYFLRRGAFNQLAALMPDFMLAVVGPSALSFMTFKGVVGLGYFDPTVVMALVGLMIAIATEPAAEVEGRFADLTLSRTVRRSDLITRTLIVAAAAAVLMLAAMTLGTIIGLACCAPANAEAPSAVTMGLLATELAAVMVCWLGIALAIASGAKRRAVAATIAGVAAFGTYLLDYLGRAWAPAEPLSRLSPFHYFDPGALVTGREIHARDLLILFAAGLAGVAVGYRRFSRRDI